MAENGFMFNGKSQFVISQNLLNVTGKSQLSQFFGAFCMFKSHQLCCCHICETQYLSVKFVKKGNNCKPNKTLTAYLAQQITIHVYMSQGIHSL